MGHQPVRIYADVEFAVLAAGHPHGCNPGQASELRTNGVVGYIAKAGQIARV